MNPRNRIVLGAIGFALVAGAAAGAGLGNDRPANAEAAADSPSSLVEDFAYPGADTVLAQHGIKLIKGDGTIQLADCGADPNNPPKELILVQTNDLTLPKPNFCFRAEGTTGYLSMEVPQVYFIRGDQTRTVAAKVEVAPEAGSDDPGAVKSVQVDPGEWQPVGIGADEGEATVLELRY
jgi:hypothetical protein